MKLSWPRSLTGQLMLAVALALLLVQGLGVILIYKAQSERRVAILTAVAASRLIGEERGGFQPRPRDRPSRFGRARVQHSDTSPQMPGEKRDGHAEARLRDILTDEGMAPGPIVILHRKATDDPVWRNRIRNRPLARQIDRERDGKLMIAAVRFEGADDWVVARVRSRDGDFGLIVPTILQTLVIYLVIVGAVALIMRRITRPLAALTDRLESFAERQDAHNQVEPEGPEDIRRLISAHNAMEARISALLDEKDVMLGAIGHDLKTPLAALRVRIESVENETERSRMAATIEDIVRTLDDILSLARVGRPSDPLERTELSALLASVVEEYEDMGDPVAFGETQRIVARLRPTWLRRGLRNLIGNALRYGGAARVSLSREDGSAVIRIDDDGPGIPADQIGAMMDPFTRGEPSRNTETGGAGLGLALARAIAEQHGGRLVLGNRIGADGTVEGLTASIILPLT